MVKVLAVDDGGSTRQWKMGINGQICDKLGAEVVRVKLADLNPSSFSGIDVVLTELDSAIVGPGSDSDKFLAVADSAAQQGNKPIIRMFSGRFNVAANNDHVDAARFTSLAGNISTHDAAGNAQIIMAAIKQAQTKVVKPLKRVLVLDDGSMTRALKGDLYAGFAMQDGIFVERALMEPVVPHKPTDLADPVPDYKFTLTDAKQLAGYDLILTDFNGKLIGDVTNHQDNKKFLDMLSEAVKAGANPQVKMFSGGFNENGGYGIDLTAYPELQPLLTLHNGKSAGTQPPLTVNGPMQKGIIPLAVEELQKTPTPAPVITSAIATAAGPIRAETIKTPTLPVWAARPDIQGKTGPVIGG